MRDRPRSFLLVPRPLSRIERQDSAPFVAAYPLESGIAPAHSVSYFIGAVASAGCLVPEACACRRLQCQGKAHAVSTPTVCGESKGFADL